MLLNELLIARDQLMLMLGLLFVVITLLFEALDLLLEMLGGLPQVGVCLLDSNRLLLLSQVLALRLIEVSFGLQLLLGKLLDPLPELHHAVLASIELVLVVLILLLHDPA